MSEVQPTVVWNAEKLEPLSANGPYYESKIFRIFGFRWYFRLYTNFKKIGNVVLGCYLVDLPPDVSRISIKFIDFIAETNTKFIREVRTFDKDFTNWCWPNGVLPAKALKPFKSFTLTTKFQLISVYDDVGKSITNQALNFDEQKMPAPMNSNKLQEYDVRLDSLTTQVDKLTKDLNQITNVLKDIKLQMNEEKKENNKDLQRQIDEINKNMKLLLSNKINEKEENKEKKEFKHWIENVVKLPEYYDLFIENGVENMKVA
eukprot:383750_1